MAYNLELVIKELNQMLENNIVANYALGGAVGASIFIEAITTEDVDVFVHFKTHENSIFLDPSPIFEYFKDRGFTMHFDTVLIGNWPVQFLPPPGALEEEALENYRELEYSGLKIRVFTPEYLAAIALKTGRNKDKARLEEFVNNDALDNVVYEGILSRHGLTEKWLDFVKSITP